MMMMIYYDDVDVSSVYNDDVDVDVSRQGTTKLKTAKAVNTLQGTGTHLNKPWEIDMDVFWSLCSQKEVIFGRGHVQ